MWLNKQITESMFVEKVKNQRLELENVKKRNKELKDRYQGLEKERSKLYELVTLNQVDLVTGKNNLNALLDKLKTQKQLNMNTAQRLEISKEQTDMMQLAIAETNNLMSNSITELKPMKEKLSFKWDVVECLQNMLIKTRLQVAEKDAIIINLKQLESELANDVKSLKNNENTSTVSQWQRAFLSAKIREADVILEFDKLKRSLAIIKHELEEKKLESMQEDNKEDEDFFQIRFNWRDNIHEQIKTEEEKSIARMIEFQNEIDYLKMQLKKLEDIKEDINKRVFFNEEVKVHLHEVRTSIFLRLQKTNQELDKVTEKCKKLEEKMTNDLLQIQYNIDQKDSEIAHLAEEIKELQLRNTNFEKSNNESMTSMNEDTMHILLEQIKHLEEEIEIIAGDNGSTTIKKQIQ